ncbi:hypothetical protein LBBP_00980 [Leptospira borgpetersenii serovar Ballum]|uniref:Uncharacterized protein n=1 Tax=Leptospira borgpetersenii serovar Ballum TaxID=280505 RepID=A0A0S2IPC4_LEPBO|nr:hypothetical protein LBBP_00980 [Leptospira borgpetersenii serovar Ballum]ANH00243.2 Uncharacterized protein LB4E_0778 [Leptospira borgpetersenii str. 4E]
MTKMIYIKFEILIRDYLDEKDDFLGMIGYINLCIIIPCRKSNEYTLNLEYRVDNNLRKAEKYKEQRTLWIWLPLVLYNIFTFSNDSSEFLEDGFKNTMVNISPNIANTVSDLENENKSLRSVENSKEKSEWEKVNKNSIKNIVRYLENANEGDIKNQAAEFLNNLFDKKVQTYLVNRYPFVKPYLKNIVLYPNGDPVGETQFFQIFTRLVLEKDSETGFKQEVKLFQKNGKIIWEITYDGETKITNIVPGMF